jgi:hypothetical protein
MTQADDVPPTLLSLALRAIRRLRGMRPPALATALRMKLRSYEYFESGVSRVNTERVLAFADATNSDGYAILAGLWIGSPDFAARCADNKLMTILILAVQDLDTKAGDAIATLDAQTLMGVFEETFSGLAAEALRRSAKDLLRERASRLPRPKRNR